MFKTIKSRSVAVKSVVGSALLLGLLGQASAAVTMDPALVAAIADAIALILLVIAAGGLGYLTISGASVGWTVASKFIRRLGGKA